jgi:hypothetical protein
MIENDYKIDEIINDPLESLRILNLKTMLLTLDIRVLTVLVARRIEIEVQKRRKINSTSLLKWAIGKVPIVGSYINSQ